LAHALGYFNYQITVMDGHLNTTNSPSDRRKVAPAKDPQRSAIGNGSALLPGVDGRSAWVRRCKELIADHISDCGGEDSTSAAERSIIRRAAVLTVELERLELKFAQAGEASVDDLDLYQRTAGNLRRLLEAIGLQRRAKPVPSLQEYLASLPPSKSGGGPLGPPELPRARDREAVS
jgi:hypothetical protein